MIDDRLNRIWSELLKHCKTHNQFEFIFKIEDWGHLWMPWFIYIDDQSLNFSVNDISSEDLRYFEDNGYIELIEEIEPIDKMDVSIKKYKIVQKA